MQQYLAEISTFPVLTVEQERDLSRRAASHREEVVSSLVRSNLSFVVRIAGEYRHLGVEFEELLNEGNIGLLQAARRYDWSRGNRFITYAVWWIRKAMLKSVTAQSTVVHVSSYHLKKQGQDAGAQRVREVSLDARLRDDGGSFADTLPDSGRPSAEEESIRDEHAHLLRKVLRTLRPLERQVLCERFGLADRTPRTLREIGMSMGISRERVRQIELQGKRKIREFFSRHPSAREARAVRRWTAERGGVDALRRAASA
jgi:RNA polymerase primary sigma factor